VFIQEKFDIIRHQVIGAGGEIQLADVINSRAKNNSIELVTLNGHCYESGSV